MISLFVYLFNASTEMKYASSAYFTYLLTSVGIFYYTDLFFNLFGMTNNVNERLAIKFGLIAIYRFESMFRKL